MYCDIPVFGRCCFCLPLRKGILVCGYINVLYSSFMVGLYSYWLHHSSDHKANVIYHGVSAFTMCELILFIYCVDVVINCLLVYGAHQKVVIFLKIFYYYTIMTCVAAMLLQVISLTLPIGHSDFITDLVLTFTALSIQLYLLLLVRSLCRKLEIGNQHTFDNQLQSVVTAENGIYTNTTFVSNDS